MLSGGCVGGKMLMRLTGIVNMMMSYT
jgi:hypothetical protein